jgi:hypothetical protein
MLTECAFSDVSRSAELSIQCYLRKDQPKRDGDGLADDMGNDIFMGSLKITPTLITWALRTSGTT